MFKRGDLVIGKPNNSYAITSSKSISIVTREPSMEGGMMDVKVLYNGDVGECAMDEYSVRSDGFTRYSKELAKSQGLVYMSEHEQARYLKTLRKAINKPHSHDQMMFLSRKFRVAIHSNRDRVLMTNINEKEELILTQLDKGGYSYSDVRVSKINLSDVKTNTFNGVRGLAGFRGIGLPMNFVRWER